MRDNELPDEQLLAELRGLFSRAEPVPEWVVETAKASYDLRSLDVELALLTWDSEVDTPAVAVRGPAGVLGVDDGPRALSFECGDLDIEVEIAGPQGGRRLLGQLTPPQAARVEVQRLRPGGHPSEVDSVVVEAVIDVDDLGRFGVDVLPAGLVRITCVRADRRDVVTDWVRVD